MAALSSRDLAFKFLNANKQTSSTQGTSVNKSVSASAPQNSFETKPFNNNNNNRNQGFNSNNNRQQEFNNNSNTYQSNSSYSDNSNNWNRNNNSQFTSNAYNNHRDTRNPDQNYKRARDSMSYDSYDNSDSSNKKPRFDTSTTTVAPVRKVWSKNDNQSQQTSNPVAATSQSYSEPTNQAPSMVVSIKSIQSPEPSKPVQKQPVVRGVDPLAQFLSKQKNEDIDVNSFLKKNRKVDAEEPFNQTKKAKSVSDPSDPLQAFLSKASQQEIDVDAFLKQNKPKPDTFQKKQKKERVIQERAPKEIRPDRFFNTREFEDKNPFTWGQKDEPMEKPAKRSRSKPAAEPTIEPEVAANDPLQQFLVQQNQVSAELSKNVDRIIRGENRMEDEEELQIVQDHDEQIDTDMKKGNVWVMSKNTVPLEETSLHTDLVDILTTKMQISELFAVQRAVIPVAIAMTDSQTPGDICVCSPTGSGKTLSYVLPILHSCMNQKFRKLRALVLVPNSALGRQVYEVFIPFTKKLHLAVEHCESLPFPVEQEKIVTRVGTDYFSTMSVIISTPARILQHIRETPGFVQIMKGLKYIVLDEVDAMTNTTDRTEALRSVLIQYESAMTSSSFAAHIPVPTPHVLARKILCSATLTPHSGRLSQLNLHRPQFFTNISRHAPLAQSIRVDSGLMDDENFEENIDRTQKYSTPSRLLQYVVPYDQALKPLFFVGLLLHPSLQIFSKSRRVLCFCDTTEIAIRLNAMINSFIATGAWEQFIKLNEEMASKKNEGEEPVDLYQGMAMPDESSGYKISAVYDPSQLRGTAERKKFLKDFAERKFTVMFCTDILGRGMNLQADTVINYDPPSYLKTYMHRVGRTARGTSGGLAITMCQKRAISTFKSKLTKRVSMDNPIEEYHVSATAIRAMAGESFKKVIAHYNDHVLKKKK